MATITAWVLPTDDIETRSGVGATGAHAHMVLDGVDVWLSDPLTPAALRDAGIVSTANMLIGVLVGLRDEAARRIALANVESVDWAPGELVEMFGS